MDALAQLERNVQQLLTQYQELQSDMQRLKEENVRQRDEIVQSHAELQQLKRDYQRLQAAHALVTQDTLNDEQRLAAKKQITALITRLDRAIELLKQ